MARTITQIYNEIITEKETQSELSAIVPNPETASNLFADVTSNSKVAIWRLIFWVVAVSIWTHEKLFDEHAIEIEARANEIVTGTLRWYRDQALKFQYGDLLQWDDDLLKYNYLPGSTGLKVVKMASAIQVSDQVRIKVAKDNGTGGLEPLTPTQQTSFTTYMNRIKFAGTNIQITNVNPDRLKLQLTINYDPLLLDSTGLLISDGTTFPVVDAINGYIQNLPFDGTFNLTNFIDAIQNAVGVVDPVLVSCEARTGASLFAPTGQNYIADAGYLIIDPSFPLDNVGVVNYVPVNS